MDLQPSDIEEAIRAASEAFLRDAFPLPDSRNRPADAWAKMAEMGWFGIGLPEESGGIAVGLGAEALVFAELGRHLAPAGAIAAAVGARVAHDAGEQALAQDIASGARRVAIGLADHRGFVRALDIDGASLIVVTTAEGGAVHELPAEITTGDCLDLSMRQAVLRQPLGAARATVASRRSALHQQIAAAAFALGCAEAGRDMAVEYAKTREQFGKPIGSFQALKHIMADMAVRCSAARAQVMFAAMALETGRDDAPFHVVAAKRMADTAAVDNGRANIQIHGGIGMTDEAHPHLVLKRAHLLSHVSPALASDLLAA